jgi:hypothetical protein
LTVLDTGNMLPIERHLKKGGKAWPKCLSAVSP